MGDIEVDARFLEAALPELKDYLFSKELYWPLPAFGGSGQIANFLRLTPGNLLLSRLRLKLWPEPVGQEELISSLDDIRDRWRSHWVQKVEKEIPARLTLWSNFISEARREGGHRSVYRYHVRLRVMLGLLMAEASRLPAALQEQLRALDGHLKEITVEGPFVWERELEDGFPAKDYWFLYRDFQSGNRKNYE